MVQFNYICAGSVTCGRRFSKAKLCTLDTSQILNKMHEIYMESFNDESEDQLCAFKRSTHIIELFTAEMRVFRVTKRYDVTVNLHCFPTFLGFNCIVFIFIVKTLSPFRPGNHHYHHFCGESVPRR